MKRQRSREIAMELLFSMELSKNSIDETIEMFIENYELNLNTVDMEYIKKVISTVTENLSKIDEILSGAMDNWKIERISKVNLTILRLAVAEMLYLDDVPGRVAINEAIELTKRYSDEKSKAFVNGILDRVLKSLDK